MRCVRAVSQRNIARSRTSRPASSASILKPVTSIALALVALLATGATVTGLGSMPATVSAVEIEAIIRQAPPAPPVTAGYEAREELASAGDAMGARRVLRFVHVSDAHILDDDAPYPARQQPLDPISPFSSAERPQEEYTDEVLAAIVRAINAQHAMDPFDFVLNTGDNIDNDLENELMRFIDVWDGTSTTQGPVSGLACVPDGQSPSHDDDSNDVTDRCTSLPEALLANHTALAPGLPWYSAFGNHDALIQGNVNPNDPFNGIAGTMGRHLLTQPEYVAMHFTGDPACPGEGQPVGSAGDDFGHGYGMGGARLCDDDPDNDGYYSFALNGVLVVVLDTVNDDFVTANGHLAGRFTPQQHAGADVIGGYAEGSLDPQQYAWLQEEIAANPDKLVVLFSHHTVNSMFTNLGDGPCAPIGCLADLLRGAGYQTGEQLTAELAALPNMGAWIGGHTHRHRVQAKTAGEAGGGFWNIETSSLIDYPQEARVIELWVTLDGAQAFWLLQPFGHDFQLSKDLEATDPQRDASAQGEVGDRAVALWMDLPPEVTLSGRPDWDAVWGVPRTYSANGRAYLENRVLVVDEAVRPVSAEELRLMEVSWQVTHLDNGTTVTDVPAWTPLEAQVSVAAHLNFGGQFALAVEPERAHNVTMRVAHPQWGPRTASFQLDFPADVYYGDDIVVGSDCKQSTVMHVPAVGPSSAQDCDRPISALPAVIVVGLLIAVAMRRRR